MSEPRERSKARAQTTEKEADKEPLEDARDAVVARATAADEEAALAESERRFGRMVAVGIPTVTVVGAIGVGAASSVAPGLLVLAGGVLLGVISLLWASLRTLAGDAPLPADLEALAARARNTDTRTDAKRRVLRALKDLENEHELGRIDDADYEQVAQKYRDEAKNVMRAMDEAVLPLIAKAEEIATAHLRKHGLAAGSPEKTEDKEPAPEPAASEPAAPEPPARARSPYDDEPTTDGSENELMSRGSAKSGPAQARGRRACPKCTTSNEADAAFCKKCGQSLRDEREAGDEAEEANHAS